jgi:hypothetical protein
MARSLQRNAAGFWAQANPTFEEGNIALRPLTIVTALALAAAAFSNFAAVTRDNRLVKLLPRADQNIYQSYGRDSVYAFSGERKP